MSQVTNQVDVPLIDELLALEDVSLLDLLVRQTETLRGLHKIRQVARALYRQFRSVEGLEVGGLRMGGDYVTFPALVQWQVGRSSYRLSLEVIVGRESGLDEQGDKVDQAFQLVLKYVLRGHDCRFRMAAKTSQNRDGSMEIDIYQQALLTIEGLPVVVENLWY